MRYLYTSEAVEAFNVMRPKCTKPFICLYFMITVQNLGFLDPSSWLVSLACMMTGPLGKQSPLIPLLPKVR